ncbi:MAG: family 43 glycosylhydrolase [Candidatus Symbiothrix sp.]|jgi:beta-xylosidase|nr:family 43 glycosylhydrolase [Candidatus Symbiothrix sp.]
MRIRFHFIIFTACIATGVCAQQNLRHSAAGSNSHTVTLTNPVIPGYFADPSLVQYEGKFYVYATCDPWGGDSLACWVSDDFQKWTLHFLNYPTKEQCTSPSSNDNKVWAPSVVQKGDYFYMYVSVGSEVWCGKASHPLGPWKNMLGDKPLIAYDKTKYYHVIDAEAFIDDDGRAYLYWGSGWEWINGHCYAAELGDDMSSFKTNPVEVTPKNYFEGPFMIKHGGKYFLTYSDGKTIDSTYKVRYAVGESPFGPFTEAPNSPILQTTPELQVYGPGHHSFFRFRGKNYILYHRHSLPFKEGTAMRQICINEFEFDHTKGLIKNIAPNNTQKFPRVTNH